MVPKRDQTSSFKSKEKIHYSLKEVTEQTHHEKGKEKGERYTSLSTNRVYANGERIRML